jgi:hypothetical protein
MLDCDVKSPYLFTTVWNVTGYDRNGVKSSDSMPFQRPVAAPLGPATGSVLILQQLLRSWHASPGHIFITQPTSACVPKIKV